ncbi:MAG: hypothetical protein NXI01_03030 [Gammaproteobacteria bacterium]|nr:hypothetical protein [Gammaproteobacteria bacterium]
MLFEFISEFSTAVLDQVEIGGPIYLRSLRDEVYDDDYWGFFSREEKIIYTAVGAGLVFIFCCICGICCYKQRTSHQAIAASAETSSTGTAAIYDEDEDGNNRENTRDPESNQYNSITF